MGGDPGQDVLEPGEGIDSGPLAGRHQTPQHRSRFAALVAAKEHPVVATNSYAADRALGGVVVDLEISVVAEAGQRRPVLQGVAHRPPLRTLRQNFSLDLQ